MLAWEPTRKGRNSITHVWSDLNDFTKDMEVMTCESLGKGGEGRGGGFTTPLNDKKYTRHLGPNLYHLCCCYGQYNQNTSIKKQVAIGYTWESRYRDQKHVPIPILRFFFNYLVNLNSVSALFYWVHFSTKNYPSSFWGGGKAWASIRLAT